MLESETKHLVCGSIMNYECQDNFGRTIYWCPKCKKNVAVWGFTRHRKE